MTLKRMPSYLGDGEPFAQMALSFLYGWFAGFLSQCQYVLDALMEACLKPS